MWEKTEPTAGKTATAGVIRVFRAFLDGKLQDPQFREAYERLSLANQIVEARSRAEISQAELARRIGLKPQKVARLESGREFPTIPILRRIAKVLNREFVITIKP